MACARPTYECSPFRTIAVIREMLEVARLSPDEAQRRAAAVFLFKNGVALPKLESEVEAAIERWVSEWLAKYMPSGSSQCDLHHPCCF